MNVDSLAQRVGDITDPTEDQLLRGRRQLEDATQRAGARVLAVRRSRRRSQRRWGITALAGVAAATAAALVVPLVNAAPASAEEILRVTAEAAGQQPDEAVGARYWYVRSEVDYPETEPFQREIWLGRTDETVLRDEAISAGLFAGPATEPAEVRTEGSGGPATFGVIVDGEPVTWQILDSLPTDPEALEAVLRKEAVGASAGEENALWESVTSLLRESPASPALRQALWEVAAGMPDVDLIGPMTDAAGRQGVGIERNQLDQDWYRVVYVVDPETGALLESRDINADGTVAWRATQLVQEPSDTAPVAQPPICGPGSVPERSC